MDKHTCKLCFRRFSNGRALGGHMRSHVASCLPPPPPLLSSSASSDQEEEQETQVGSNSVVLGGSGGGNYGLRENPRKSFRLVDPQFNNSQLYSSGAVLYGESDSDGSCKQPIGVSRRRSLRRQSPVSSVSDTPATADEDVALCLVMLSRDSWSNTTPIKRTHQEQETTEEFQSESSEDEKRRVFSSVGSRKIERGRRSRYQCETCKKVFRSYQALGGHRANHKKLKPTATEDDENDDHCRDSIQDDDCDDGCGEDSLIRIPHECPVCLRVFGSAQALGGHKRVHVVSGSGSGSGSGSSPSPPLLLPRIPTDVFVGSVKLERSFIDLNLPAPIE